MKTVDAIIDILQRENVEYLCCFPTTSVIDAAASVGMRPIICRQERVGVGIADGFARVTNGRRPAVFAMQYGPGAEKRLCGRRNGLLGLHADAAHPPRAGHVHRRRPAHLQLRGQLQLRHEVGRAT